MRIDYGYYSGNDLHRDYHLMSKEHYMKSLNERHQEFFKDLHKFSALKDVSEEVFTDVFCYLQDSGIEFRNMLEQIEIISKHLGKYLKNVKGEI